MPSHIAILALVPLAAMGACLATPTTEIASGQRLFADNCAACHGADAKGGGAAAEALDEAPPDLTRLATRNGGTFPATAVMAAVWGDDPASHRATMPEFATFFDDDPLVRYDGGDGIESPTPVGLVQLAEYLKTLQE